jgi:hypothetical protein
MRRVIEGGSKRGIEHLRDLPGSIFGRSHNQTGAEVGGKNQGEPDDDRCQARKEISAEAQELQHVHEIQPRDRRGRLGLVDFTPTPYLGPSAPPS